MTRDARPRPSAQGFRWRSAAFCVVAAGLWVILVGRPSPHEMELGAACAGSTVAFTLFMVRTAGVRIELRLRDLVQGWRIPWYVASDAVVVLSVLMRDVLHVEGARNLYRVCGFDSSKRDPVRIARTVLAVAYATCSPNCIVIGIDQAQSRMLFHQLHRSPVPKMLRALGAKG